VTNRRRLDHSAVPELERSSAATRLPLCPPFFSKDGFRFFFYSNDHKPVHVHVRYQDGEAVFDVESGVELRESYGLKLKDLSKAEELATEHRALIISKWHEYFD